VPKSSQDTQQNGGQWAHLSGQLWQSHSRSSQSPLKTRQGFQSLCPPENCRQKIGDTKAFLLKGTIRITEGGISSTEYQRTGSRIRNNKS
jgi:hypothetical protein